ncbi:MAG TPA: cytochrome c oxidase assembly factor Coa1 family protein [Pirellulaceae bacterium]|jgi:hypothetical protein|nr:cytochrome c oxidase assembly factor Coa1 family protein [Pirellulaceae bacterium]
MSDPSPPPASRPSTGARLSKFFGERRWARLLLFAIVGLPPLVGVVGGPLILMYRLNAEVKASEAYRQSLEAVRASSVVREAIGSPIEPAYWTEAQIVYEDKVRYAAVRYDVAGPDGKATIEYDASFVDEVWTLARAKAKFSPEEPFVRIWPAGGKAKSSADPPDDDVSESSNDAAQPK